MQLAQCAHILSICFGYRIQEQFEEMGFDCQVVPYFSTQSGIGQRMGEALGMKCTFAILARRQPVERLPET